MSSSPTLILASTSRYRCELLARLRLRVVKRDREAEVFRYLEREVWPSVPRGVLGRRLTRREEDQILGYGKEGA